MQVKATHNANMSLISPYKDIEPLKNHYINNGNSLDLLNLDKLEITIDKPTSNIDKHTLSKYKKFRDNKSKTNKLARGLIKTNPNSKLKDKYKQTLYCSNTLHSYNGEVHKHTCKNKWCLNCNRKKASKDIEKYLPEILNWNDKQLLTLTRQSIRSKNLNRYLTEFTKIFKKINGSRLWNKHSIVKKYIRKLEFTYNQDTRLFHIHFHLITYSKDCAELIKNEWIRLNNELGTELKGKQPVISKLQDIRSIDDTEKAIKEIVKYVNKFEGMDDLKALNTILEKLYKKRALQPVGFKISSPEPEQVKIKTKKQIIPNGTWKWNNKINDYISQYGEVLSYSMKYINEPPETYIN